MNDANANRFSPTLELFDSIEKEESGGDGGDERMFFTDAIERGGVSCEVVVEEKSGRVIAGIERDEEGDFLYQGTYDDDGNRSGEKCVTVGIGDSVVYGSFKNGKPNGWCVYVYPKIADVRKALLSEEDGRVRESGMKNLIKQCDYIVGYFTDGYVPRFDQDMSVRETEKDAWYRSAKDDRAEMTLDEEMDAILICLGWTEETYGFDNKSTCEKIQWLSIHEMEVKSKDARPFICPFEMNSITTNLTSIHGCKEGELVAIYSSYPAVVQRLKGSSRRWDLRDKLVALEDSSDEEEDSDSDEKRGQETDAEKRGRGGLFLLCDGRYDRASQAPLTTYGTNAAVHVKEEFNCERTPLYHWKMIGSDYCLCLRALRDIKANERISVGPDYTGGWRLNPYSEAGYYHHLMNTPDKIIFETNKMQMTTTSGKGRTAKKARIADSEEENISNVKIKRHGPWLCAYIDNVEQGLLYDENWREGDEDGDDDDESNEEKDNKKVARIDRSVVGFEYIRAMATIAIAIGCAAEHGWLVPILYPTQYEESLCSSEEGLKKQLRILNLGFGTGALSGFLCSKLKHENEIVIESVEYSKQMCDAILRNSNTLEFPKFPNEIIHECSAECYLEDELERMSAALPRVQGFSCAFLDCYDGQGNIPKRCLEKSFIQNIRDCLEKTRGGILVCNCWSGNLEALVKFHDTLSSVFSLSRESGVNPQNWNETVRIYKEPSGQTNNCVVVAVRTRARASDSSESLREVLPRLSPEIFDVQSDFSFSDLENNLEEFRFSFNGVRY